MISKEKQVERAIRTLLDRADAAHSDWELDLYPSCSEPGYDDVPMLTANWNNVPRKLFDWLEREFDWADERLLHLGWCDEWIRCSHCNSAVRESPDNYGWLPAYAWVSDCEILCLHCCDSPDFQEEVIEWYANKPTMALGPDWEEILEANGFECATEDDRACPRYETGLHRGQDDDPREVFAELKKRFEKVWDRTQVIFIMKSKGQFDLNWGVYYRVREEDE